MNVKENYVLEAARKALYNVADLYRGYKVDSGTADKICSAIDGEMHRLLGSPTKNPNPSTPIILIVFDITKDHTVSLYTYWCPNQEVAKRQLWDHVARNWEIHKPKTPLPKNIDQAIALYYKEFKFSRYRFYAVV